MSRNSRRRHNFFLEDAEDYLEPVDAFSNPDLDSRVQIFSSEAQVLPKNIAEATTLAFSSGTFMFGGPIWCPGFLINFFPFERKARVH